MVIFFQELESINLTWTEVEQKLLISQVDWQQYLKIISALKDNSSYRLSYLSGLLEIMSPSKNHELLKKNIARLLEAYLEFKEIDYWGYGSTTWKNAEKTSGLEADEAYCLEKEKTFPDLAIEIVLTSGGINKLEIYQNLQIKEVWFWQNNQLFIYQLIQGEYQPRNQSALLPELDIKILRDCLPLPPREALKQFQAKILQK